MLHAFGADLSAPDSDGTTPAFVAAENGNAEALAVLAELGADLDATVRERGGG